MPNFFCDLYQLMLPSLIRFADSSHYFLIICRWMVNELFEYVDDVLVYFLQPLIVEMSREMDRVFYADE